MSIHKSLSRGDTLKRHKNVLSREERISILEEKNKWQEGDSIYNLPKVANRKAVVKKKAKKKEDEADATAAAEE